MKRGKEKGIRFYKDSIDFEHVVTFLENAVSLRTRSSVIGPVVHKRTHRNARSFESTKTLSKRKRERVKQKLVLREKKRYARGSSEQTHPNWLLLEPARGGKRGEWVVSK